MDTLLIPTPHYHEQFALSLGKESPFIFSRFNLLKMDTFYGSLVSGFDSTEDHFQLYILRGLL